MKNILIATLLAFSFTACKAQQKQKKIMIPKITKDFEKFDISHFDATNENTLINKEDFDVIELTQSYGYISKSYLRDSFFSIIRKLLY